MRNKSLGAHETCNFVYPKMILHIQSHVTLQSIKDLESINSSVRLLNKNQLKMIEKKFLVFAFMVSLTIFACQGTAQNQNSDSDFSRFDILSPNQNRIGHGVYEVSFFFVFF